VTSDESSSAVLDNAAPRDGALLGNEGPPNEGPPGVVVKGVTRLCGAVCGTVVCVFDGGVCGVRRAARHLLTSSGVMSTRCETSDATCCGVSGWKRPARQYCRGMVGKKR